MRTKLQKAWESRAPRERWVIIALAIILSMMLYVWLVVSAGRARAQLRSSVPILRTQAAQLEQHASEYERLHVVPRSSINPVDLRILMQTQADVLGISHALANVDIQTPDQAQVVMDAVPFAEWLGWVAALQSLHVRLDTSRITALPASGMVNVKATFVRIAAR